MKLSGRLLVVTAVPAERDAVLAGLVPDQDAPAVAGSTGADVIAVGVGPAAAAAGTARSLALAEAAGRPYATVLCTGIAGGFAGRTTIGDLALADRSVAADLGAGSPDGFLALDELGFGATVVEPDPVLLKQLREALPAATVGAVLTVSTVTGTAAAAGGILARHPDAVAEAMEGFGAGTAAAQAGVAFAELRSVSNLVGPRDRAAWRISDALQILTSTFATLRDAR